MKTSTDRVKFAKRQRFNRLQRVGVVLGLTILALICTADSGFARDCGDNIDGERVPCNCGDSVVVETKLEPDDPVLSRRCPLDGLTVRAHPMAETIVLDLAGLAMRGTGAGIGVLIESGGADGAVVLGGTADQRGQLVGFGTGFKTRSGGVLRSVRHLEISGSQFDGVSIRSKGTLVIDVLSERNGGDGIRFAGQGGRLIGVIASENKGSGIRLSSRDVIVEAVSTNNGLHGIANIGIANDVSALVSKNNGGYGLVIAGGRHKTDGAVFSDNRLGDVGSDGDKATVEP